VLFLGTLEPRKNVPGLLEAYRQLAVRWPEVPPLVLAGRTTPAAAAWLAATTAPPLAGRVQLRGYVEASGREELIAGARVLVLPSFDEGFGLPVLEAMSLGIPVVASERGALPEVAGDAGRLVNPDDPAAIARALEDVLRDDALARTLGERGRQRAAAFTWERTATVTREAYGRAIECHRNQGRVH
jgi:alpha-1,3-rhamnosyl/mannosyltransferase